MALRRESAQPSAGSSIFRGARNRAGEAAKSFLRRCPARRARFSTEAFRQDEKRAASAPPGAGHAARLLRSRQSQISDRIPPRRRYNVRAQEKSRKRRIAGGGPRPKKPSRTSRPLRTNENK